MRLIYNDALNKRVLPYLERLTKKKSNLDKETAALFDIFMLYFNMDTRYGTYSDKLEPCIISIIKEEIIKSVANLFDGKLSKLLRYLLEAQSTLPVHSRLFTAFATCRQPLSALQSRHRCVNTIPETTCHRLYGTSHTERWKYTGRNRSIQRLYEL